MHVLSYCNLNLLVMEVQGQAIGFSSSLESRMPELSKCKNISSLVQEIKNLLFLIPLALNFDLLSQHQLYKEVSYMQIPETSSFCCFPGRP